MRFTPGFSLTVVMGRGTRRTRNKMNETKKKFRWLVDGTGTEIVGPHRLSLPCGPVKCTIMLCINPFSFQNPQSHQLATHSLYNIYLKMKQYDGD